MEKIKIKAYQTIYELLEAIEEGALKRLEPTIDEVVLGQAEIIAEFKFKKQRVAGCRVAEGKITKNDRLHLKRSGEMIGDCRVKSMRSQKDVIGVAQKSEEFGVILSPQLDFEVGDVIVSYRPNEEGTK